MVFVPYVIEKKSITFSDNTIIAEGSGDFLKLWVKRDLMYKKRWQQTH